MNILEKITAYKKQEIKNLPPKGERKFAHKDFLQAIQGKEKIKLIAEIKQKSPSNPQIFQGENFNPVEIAIKYKNAGASAISVLTDKQFFGGSFNDLAKAKEASDLPVLAKDFFISKEQIDVAYQHGADAILLIVKILSLAELQDLLVYAEEKGLSALVEIADEDDLQKVLQTSAKIIGINNRNLENFVTKRINTFKLAKKLPKDCVIVSLSGLRGADVQVFKGLVDAVLVGTQIMQAENYEKKIKEFIKPRPLLKICGVRDQKTAEYCEKIGVDFCGFNFVPSSRRVVELDLASDLRKCLKNTFAVGVFQNQDLDYVNKIADELDLDFVQLHGEESPIYCEKVARPIIKVISLENEKDLEKISQYEQVVDILLFDARQAGAGEEFDHNLLQNIAINKPFFIAGGVNVNNAQKIISKFDLIGLDTASGAEEDGQISLDKISQLFNLLS